MFYVEMNDFRKTDRGRKWNKISGRSCKLTAKI